MSRKHISDLISGKDRIGVTLYSRIKEWNEDVLYIGMDGMYAKLLCSDGDIINATGYVVKIDDHYIFEKDLVG